MKPCIAICNIFGQDTDRLIDFAHLNGFKGIDWSIDQNQSEKEFILKMEKLRGLEVRFHCPFPGVEFACADERADKSMELLTHMVERVAMAGGKHMTVHTGFDHIPDRELNFNRAVENLSTLVQRGAECGVSVSLENLTKAWTSVPALFTTIIQQSGAGVTLDIGHAHVCEPLHTDGNIYEHYILPNQDKIINAHIYHTELDGLGHVVPESLEDIYNRLELLRRAESCKWWVIELQDIKDILHTRDLLNRYFESSSNSCVPVKKPSRSCQTKNPESVSI
ncbi:MAG: TIM barrel protein [Deltaproteobacteria bacterium]|nr:TIM barrel protein [Deltaproteobacteria bacterium]